MDQRMALAKNTQLQFKNKQGGAVLYTIVREISRGGSCIVYDASYETNSGAHKRVRIKECYPCRLRVSRGEEGDLEAVPEDRAAFLACQNKCRSDFLLGNGLYYADGLYDGLTCTLDIYSAYGTVYLVSTYSPENTLATYRPKDLKTCIHLVSQVARILKRIHNEGYLYLDIKPENVLVADTYTTRVQLFDFDSLIPLSAAGSRGEQDFSNIRLSYSRGFAAIELRTAKLRKIGTHTDVYGVGALLYYLLFDRTPAAADCEAFAVYNYKDMVYSTAHSDRLWFALNEFFHNALANFYRDRWHDMQQVIDALGEIEGYADMARPYIRSTPIAGPALFAGRQSEMNRLNQWLEGDSPCMFVTGMGGIGKSTLIRAFLSRYRDRIDSLLYLSYHDSLIQTMTDDYAAGISTVAREQHEGMDAYFLRKLNAFRSIVEGTKSVLVIDNYDGTVDRNLLQLLAVGWKVILISRRAPASDEYDILPLSAIRDQDELYLLYAHHLDQELTLEDKQCIDGIIRKVDGHTLVLDLVARQIAASHLTIPQAAELVERHGFANMSPEQVVLQKDGTAAQNTIRGIITALYEADHLTEDMRSLLKVVSLLRAEGIDVHLLHRILELESKNDAKSLIAGGWLILSGRMISMHPVIRETVRGWVWTQDNIRWAVALMTWLFRELKLEGRKEDYPKSLLDIMELSKDQFHKHPWLETWFHRYTQKHGVIGDTLRQRYERSEDREPSNRERVARYVQIAEGVIIACDREQLLRQQEIYPDFLFITLLNTPRHKEDFLLKYSAALINHPASRNVVALMKLYRCMLNVYQERKDFASAFRVLKEGEQASRKLGSNYVLALYYDMESEFWDHALGGAYDAVEVEEAAMRKKMMRSIEKAIHHARRSRNPECRQLLASNILAKATLLIRSESPGKRLIDRLLEEAETIVLKECQPYGEVRCVYHMVRAWYYTLVTPEFDRAVENMEHAAAIAEKTAPTDLDKIDNITIPCADILCNWEEYEGAAQLLENAIELCAQKGEIIPWLRKRMELYRCLIDVYYDLGHMEQCRAILRLIDEANARYAAQGIYVDVPQELRDILAGSVFM